MLKCLVEIPQSVKMDLEKTKSGSKAEADQEWLEKDITKTLSQIESLEQMIAIKLKPLLEEIPNVKKALSKQGHNFLNLNYF
jgi:hypothetical protein